MCVFQVSKGCLLYSQAALCARVHRGRGAVDLPLFIPCRPQRFYVEWYANSNTARQGC